MIMHPLGYGIQRLADNNGTMIGVYIIAKDLHDQKDAKGS